MTDAERIDALEKQLALVVQKLDEARRRVGLSGMIDEQLRAINARADVRARANP
jgi:hypothetical protein